MSGWSCECVVLLSLVTFNVAIDVQSTDQRGYRLERAIVCACVCVRERERERERESKRERATSAEQSWCSVRHITVSWPGF